ncbi:beta-ketoacyl synthase N-terminal-like domain-containing protein [Azospirillum argentinense]
MMALVRGGSGSAAVWRALLSDPIPDHLKAAVGGVPVGWVYSACTSSAHALLCAVLDLADGRVETALVVGVDALSALEAAGFSTSGAASRTRCNPFRDGRNGTLVGEGAAALALASWAAGGEACPAILGIGLGCDARHPVEPDPAGESLEAASHRALAMAGLRPDDIGAVVFHGTGTRLNDAAEAAVYRRLFGDRRVPATAIKGSVGHTMGGAALMNCLVAAEALASGVLPPADGDVEMAIIEGIELVTSPRPVSRAPILTYSAGFGGNNAAVVVGGAG